MWVVVNVETGWSDESMRFAEYSEAMRFIKDNEDLDRGVYFDKRWESESPHPTGDCALGQIWHDGKWVDYARDKPEVAIRWAAKEPVALARVVDWISREVMWP